MLVVKKLDQRVMDQRILPSLVMGKLITIQPRLLTLLLEMGMELDMKLQVLLEQKEKLGLKLIALGIDLCIRDSEPSSTRKGCWARCWCIWNWAIFY